ncbi:MAG: hypothetical protein WCT18_02190 [Patescibacteria group bacterium]
MAYLTVSGEVEYSLTKVHLDGDPKIYYSLYLGDCHFPITLIKKRGRFSQLIERKQGIVSITYWPSFRGTKSMEKGDIKLHVGLPNAQLTVQIKRELIEKLFGVFCRASIER